VFDEDYLYFYEPRLQGASDTEAEVIWRLRKLEVGIEVLDLRVDTVGSPTGSTTAERALPASRQHGCFSSVHAMRRGGGRPMSTPRSHTKT